MNLSSKEDRLDQLLIELVEEKHPQNVSQLIHFAKLEPWFVSEEEILQRVLRLEGQGRIRFKESYVHGQLYWGTYLMSEEAGWYWITLILAAATLLAVFFIPDYSYPLMYARIVLGAIFVLFLPGYSLLKALFSEKDLDNLERLALSVGMSLAVVPIIGLILNYTIWGITITTITMSILILTLVFATAAFIKEGQSKVGKGTA